MNLRLFAIFGFIVMTTAYVTKEFEIISVIQNTGVQYLMEARCIFEVASKVNARQMEMLVSFDKKVTGFNARGTVLLNKADNMTWYNVTNTKSIESGTFVFKFVGTYKGIQPTGFCQTNLPGPSPTAKLESLQGTFSVPVVYVGSPWPVGDGVHYRSHARCSLVVSNVILPGQVNINLTFSHKTSGFQHWIGDLVSSNSNGYWYYVKNLYYQHPPVMNYEFQVNFDTVTPPPGVCVSPLMEYGITSTTSTAARTTNQASTTTKSPSTSSSTTSTSTSNRSSTTSTSTSNRSSTTSTSTSNPMNRSPVVYVDSWPTGDGVHYRMNGKCDFNLQSEIPANSLNINVTFSKPTQNYQHWIAEITSAAADGTWYYVYNKYNTYPPVMSYTFQVTYAGQTPPMGYCYSSLPGVPLTPSTSQTSTSSTTKKPGPNTSTASNNASFNYPGALANSIHFYATQRSGKLPVNNPISWRGDSALYDAGSNGEDLTGGWYDAGDHVKFNLPISSATTLLAIGFNQWKEAYTMAGQLDNMYDCIKWPLDYFLKCWRPDPNNPVYYAQVADGDIDHAWWGRPEDMTPSNMPRPAYKVTKNQPGSDVAGETSAALAAGSIAFRDRDLQYSNTLLNAAKTLYSFADTYRGKYSDTIQDAAQFYRSSGFNDELTLAAVMLYSATGDPSYLTDAENKYSQFGLNYVAWAQAWDEKVPMVQLLLYQATGKQIYADAVENYLRSWRNDVTKTPDGLAWRSQWGSLRYTANTAFVAMMAADLGLNPSTNRQWAMSQIDYMLGKNSRSFSYLVGFGNNFPRKPHHKASSCPVDKNQPCGWNDFSSPNDNPNVLVGALVGGPDANDNYDDVRSDYIKNEVTCDYNAGFQGALAGIIDYSMGQAG